MKFLYTLIFSFLYISIFSQTTDTCKISLGSDLTVCTNSKLAILYDSPLKNLSILWSGTATSSCNICPKYVPSTKIAGNYLIFATAKSGVCTVSDTLKLTVLPVAAPAATFLKTAIVCAKQKISIGNGANDPNFTYNWTSLPIGYTSDANNPNVSPAVSTTYFVTVTNANCPFPLLDTVKIAAFDFTNIGLPKSDTTICKNKSFILCKDKMQAGATYTWSPSTYCSNVNNLNATFTPSSNITYQLEVKAGLCKVGYIVPIKVTDLSIELAQGDTVKICKDTPLSLTIAKSLGVGTLTWSENGIKLGQYDNIGTVKFTPQKDVKYTVQFQNGGCIVKDSTYIKTIDNLKNITFPIDSAICKGETLFFAPLNNGVPIKDISTISWSVTPSLPFLNFKDSFSCKPDTSLLIKLTVKNSLCQSVISKFVKVNTKGDLKIKTSKTSVCEGEEIDIEGISAMATPIVWIPAINCTDKNCTKAKILLTKDTKYFASQSGGCASQDSLLIKVAEGLQNFAIGGDSVTCKGLQTKLFVKNKPIGANFTYKWTSSLPSFSTNADSIFYKSDTSFTVNLIVNNGVCEKIFSKKIVVKKSTSLSVIASKSTLCEGEIAELTIDGQTNSKVQWSPTVGCLNDKCTKVKVSPVKNETYTFTSANGDECESTGSIFIQVNASPKIQYPGQTAFCIGEKLDTIALNAAPDAATSYTWQSVDDLLFQTTNAAAPKIKPYKTATYTVKMKKGDCLVEDQVTVKVANKGFVKLMKDTTVCPGELVTLTFVTSLSKDEIQKFNWISGGAVIENKINPVLPKNVYSFTVNYIQDGIFCSFTDSVKVLLKPTPKGSILVTPDYNFLASADSFQVGKIFNFTFDDVNKSGIKNYIWSVNNTEINLLTDKNKLTYTLIEKTVVKLKTTASNGCMATFETGIFTPRRLIDVQFPKVFTPNSGDDNAIFKFFVKDEDKEYVNIDNLSIFNRWGEKVYSYDANPNAKDEPGWNGQKGNSGADLPTDAYIYTYQLRYKNKVQTAVKSGEVILLR